MLYHSDQVIGKMLLNELWRHRHEVVGLEKADTLAIDNYRNSLVVREIDHRLYSEICEDLQTAAKKFFNEPELSVNQFDYLIYLKGMYFKRHSDDVVVDGKQCRKYTSITMMYKSDDFKGGQLNIEINGEVVTPSIKKGQTIMFPSEYMHWVDPVESGRREVLVAWLH